MSDHWLTKVVAVYSSGEADHQFGDLFWPTVCRQAAKLESLLQVMPGAKILDLACGSGSMTIALALRGHRMTGIDCTPKMIDTARRYSASHKVDIEWRCSDMRQLRDHELYDAVLLRDVVFSIFETHEEDERMLQRISAALRPGGKCLLEVYNRSFALEHGVEGILEYCPSSDLFVNQKHPDGLCLRLYSHERWEKMLHGLGLAISTWDGWNWPGDPPAPPHRADFIVAEKMNSP